MDFSGLVVTCNEERRLKECLQSLRFCKELIVVDLESTDRSVEIARECGAHVFIQKRVPVVEEIREWAVDQVSFDWVVHIDPDEVFCSSHVDKLEEMLRSRDDIAVVDLPWQFYFRGKPLSCTIWGGRNMKSGPVFHRHRAQISDRVHSGIDPKPGFCKVALSLDGQGAIRHYWTDSYNQLIEKHLRYIRREGKARYEKGERFSYRLLLISTIKALKKNLIEYKGLSGGMLGIGLSMFYAWYVFRCLLSLGRYQRKLQL